MDNKDGKAPVIKVTVNPDTSSRIGIKDTISDREALALTSMTYCAILEKTNLPIGELSASLKNYQKFGPMLEKHQATRHFYIGYYNEDHGTYFRGENLSWNEMLSIAGSIMMELYEELQDDPANSHLQAFIEHTIKMYEKVHPKARFNWN